MSNQSKKFILEIIQTYGKMYGENFTPEELENWAIIYCGWLKRALISPEQEFSLNESTYEGKKTKALLTVLDIPGNISKKELSVLIKNKIPANRIC